MDLFYGGTFSGTILVSYGAFWAGSGMMMLPTVEPLLEVYQTEWDLAQANAIYHFMWAFYTLMLMCISLKIRNGTFTLTWCLFWVFITLFLTAIYYVTNVQPVLRVSGKSVILMVGSSSHTEYEYYRCYSLFSSDRCLLHGLCCCL